MPRTATLIAGRRQLVSPYTVQPAASFKERNHQTCELWSDTSPAQNYHLMQHVWPQLVTNLPRRFCLKYGTG